MPKMILTVGLPSSGKSTYAYNYVKDHPDTVIVCRDDIRHMLYGVYWGDPIDENNVTRVQHGIINSVFKKDRSVIVADTNLRRATVKNLVQLGQRWGAAIEFKYFDTAPEQCELWDRERMVNGKRSVGHQVITRMADRFYKNGQIVRFDDLATFGSDRIKYIPDESKPKAILVDLDGTIALHNRGPHDYDLLNTDSPNHQIIELVQQEWNQGTTILFASGRPDSHREMTISWIDEHVGMCIGYNSDCELFMRTAGDKRMDAIVKYELFDAFVRNDYNVKYCLDDRQQVVDMYRDIGLTVLQVAPGDF